MTIAIHVRSTWYQVYPALDYYRYFGSIMCCRLSDVLRLYAVLYAMKLGLNETIKNHFETRM